MTTPRTPTSAGPCTAVPLSWASPASGLWVASRAGEYAGFVEFRDGRFRATGAFGAALAACGTLREAKDALAAPHAARRHLSRALPHLVVGLGGAAHSVLAAVLGLLHL